MILGLLLAFACARGSLAQAAHRPLHIILVEGFTLQRLLRTGLPTLSRARRHGSLAGVSTASALAGRSSVALSMALSSAVATVPAMQEPSPPDASVAGEPGTASRVFQRRTGAAPPARAVAVHLGWGTLVRSGQADHLIGSVAARGGIEAEVRGRLDASSLTWTQLGIGPQGFLSRGCGEAASIGAPRLVFRSPSRPEAGEATLWLPTVDGLAGAERVAARLGDGTEVWIVGLATGAASSAKEDRLGASVWVTPAGKQGLLTSATTRTPGLISSLDVAPTILNRLGAPIPATMGGHAVNAEPASEPEAAVRRLDVISYTGAQALWPMFLFTGGVLALFGLPALLLIRRNPGRAASLSVALEAFLLWPLSMVIGAPVWYALGAPAHIVGLTIVSLAVTVAAYALVRALSDATAAGEPRLLRRLTTCLLVSAAALLIDQLAGQPGMKVSPLVAGPIRGIRFYGIGNEPMGLLAGSLALGAFLTGWGARVWALPLLLTAAAIGWPTVGADAGGLIGAVACFGPSLAAMAGRRLTAASAVGWTMAGMAAAWGVSLADRALYGPQASHIGAAIRLGQETGAQAVWQIAARKVAMNLGIAAGGPVVASVVIIAFAAVMATGPLRPALRELVARVPRWAAAGPPLCLGAAVSCAFNDSGIVSALFMLGVYVVVGLILIIRLTADKQVDISPDSGVC
ncbi:MAG: hypothetical protein NT029_18160 [Armatimonadetes bacterium]|nr:hypothetical protein [Armatimonadota bacterium]